MKIKELIPKLIEHYEKCINEMPEEGWYGFLSQKRTQLGICYCANNIFSKDIYGSSFTKKFTNKEEWLCDTPTDVHSYSKTKKLLQIRLNRLKEFL